jgi:isopenicillin-N N-acyltransferase-like protein
MIDMMLREVHLSGTPYAMGLEHGRQLKQGVHHLASERYELARDFAARYGVCLTREQCEEMARRHLQIHQQQMPHVIEEWQGIADGAALPIEDIFFANALTDFQDVLWQAADAEVHGCTSFLVAPDASQDGHPLIGQTWDMHASAEQVITVFHRTPESGPRSLVLSTAGCLTLIGVNEAGLCVGNNNLRPTDAEPGIIYLALLHQALGQETWDDAQAALTATGRASGHNYLLGEAGGRLADIETTATEHEVFPVETGAYVHTNHYLSDRLQAIEDPQQDQASSQHRLAQARQRLASEHQPFTPERLREALSDHDGDQLCICRHGSGREVRSCAFVVVDPASQCLWARLGPPCEGSLEKYSLEA